MMMIEPNDSERLARIETLLEQLVRTDVDKESRLRALERRLYGASGVLALLIFFREPITKFIFH